MLVCKALVVSADFLYNAVCSHAQRAFRIVIAQAPAKQIAPVSRDSIKEKGRVYGPLVEAVVAHEMDAW
jgi:hypothetical protein